MKSVGTFGFLEIQHSLSFALAAFLLALPLKGFASSKNSLKVSGNLLGSEKKFGIQFEPMAELQATAATANSNWKAAAVLSFRKTPGTVAEQPPTEPESIDSHLTATIQHFELGYFQDWYHAQLGRLVLHPITVSLNESANQFMQDSTTIDGIELGLGSERFAVALVAGAPPRSAGLVLAARLEHLEAGLAYGFKHNRLVATVSELDEPNDTLQTPQRSDLHTVELAVTVPGETFASASLFQFTREGPYTAELASSANLPEETAPAEGEKLPHDASDYRATTQLKFKASEDSDAAHWLIASLGARTFPRYFKGTAVEKRQNQSSETELRIAGGYELQAESFIAQVTLYGDYASSERYLLLAKRKSSGEPKETNSRFGLTLSSSFNF